MSKFDTFKAITGCKFKENLSKKDKIVKLLNSESFKNTIKNCSPLFKLIFLKGFGLDREFLNNSVLNDLLSSNDEEEIESMVERALSDIQQNDVDETEDGEEDEIPESSAEDSEENLDEVVLSDASNDFMSMNDLEEAQSLDQILDEFDGQNINFSNETMKFFVTSQVNALWQAVFNETNNFSIEDFKRDNFDDSIFDQTQKLFLEEYDLSTNVKTSDDYRHKYQPSAMQKLTTVRLMRDGYLGNWSGTGAGKTLSAIVFSGVINANVTLVVALNSTINGWVGEISKAYPNTSNIIVCDDLREEINIQKDKKNFVVLNYEKFQLKNKSVDFIKNLIKNIKVDFFVLDEVQAIKQRTEEASQRSVNVTNMRVSLQKVNKKMFTLAMTATPVINNLVEVNNLLEFLTMKDFSTGDNKISTRRTISNAIDYHIQLMNHGVRLIKKLDMKPIKESVEKICADSSLESLNSIKQSNGGRLSMLDVEIGVFDVKMKFILKELRRRKSLGIKKHIIYTESIDRIVNMMESELINEGFKPSRYIGGKENQLALMTEENKGNYDFTLPNKDYRFIDGDSDVLIASSSVGTGVDGLQEVCNSFLIFTLPWTSSAYEQLMGRLFRQGTKFDQVYVYIPIIYINSFDEDGNEIKKSNDQARFNAIKNKKTLSDACVDGSIPDISSFNTSLVNKQFSDAVTKAFEEKDVVVSNRPMLAEVDMFTVTTSDVNVKRKESRLKELHDNLKRSGSNKIVSKKEELEEYHTLRDELKKTWDKDPAEVLYEKYFSKFKRKRIADFGCGRNLILSKIKEQNEVFAFDHAGLQEDVIECNVTDVSEYIETDSLDYVICCLSMWGTKSDKLNQLNEAHRVLEHGGRLFYVDTQDNVKKEEMKDIFVECGFDFEKSEIVNISSRFDLRIVSKF